MIDQAEAEGLARLFADKIELRGFRFTHACCPGAPLTYVCRFDFICQLDSAHPALPIQCNYSYDLREDCCQSIEDLKDTLMLRQCFMLTNLVEVLLVQQGLLRDRKDL